MVWFRTKTKLHFKIIRRAITKHCSKYIKSKVQALLPHYQCKKAIGHVWRSGALSLIKIAVIDMQTGYLNMPMAHTRTTQHWLEHYDRVPTVVTAVPAMAAIIWHPDSNEGWANVGQQSRRWANVGTTYIAVWATNVIYIGKDCLLIQDSLVPRQR